MTFRADGPSRRYGRGQRLRADDVNKLSAAVRALNSPTSETRVKSQSQLQARDLPAHITSASATQGDAATINYDAVSIVAPFISVAGATPANRPWPSGVEITALAPGDPCVLRVGGGEPKLLLMGAEEILTSTCPAQASAALAPAQVAPPPSLPTAATALTQTRTTGVAAGRYARAFLFGAA